MTDQLSLLPDGSAGLIRSLKWQGSKSCLPSTPLGQWVLGHLPRPPGFFYVEAFAGSAAILLNRPPVNDELLNDANGNLVNFFRVCQQQASELADLIAKTPFAEEEFLWAQTLLTDTDNRCGQCGRHNGLDLERALAMVIVNQQKRQFLGGDQRVSGSRWSFIHHADPTRKGIQRTREWCKVDILAIGDRLRNVRIANRDALTILDQVKQFDFADIYLDPPYPSRVSKKLYDNVDVDYDRMTDLLHQQKGRVALSGQGNEWDDLGWRKVTKVHTERLGQNSRQGNIAPKKLEALWMNY